MKEKTYAVIIRKENIYLVGILILLMSVGIALPSWAQGPWSLTDVNLSGTQTITRSQDTSSCTTTDVTLSFHWSTNTNLDGNEELTYTICYPGGCDAAVQVGQGGDPTGADVTRDSLPSSGTISIDFSLDANQAAETADVTNITITCGGADTPTLTLSVSPSSVMEGGTTTGTVSRSDTSGAFSVEITLSATGDVKLGTAPGADTYTVNFAAGGLATKTFNIIAVNDTNQEGTEIVTLTATPDAAGLALGFSDDTADVTVIDNDYAGSYGGQSLGFPTFLMTASYDWLHNFYDDNEEADGTTTDPDTDNSRYA